MKLTKMSQDYLGKSEKAIFSNKSSSAFIAANEQSSESIKFGLFLPMRNGYPMYNKNYLLTKKRQVCVIHLFRSYRIRQSPSA